MVKKTPRYLAYLRRCREEAAARAIAAGRVPGRMGQPPKNRSAEELREMRRVKNAKWRAENRDRAREIGRESMRRAAAQKAIAEGREPGKKGPKPLPREEYLARKAARTKKSYYADLEHSRAMAAKKERDNRAAKKAGTFVPKKRRLTDEERRLKNVANGQARRARLKAADGKWNISDLRVMRWRQNGICPICNRLLGEHGLSVDHWVPLKLGGSNGTENMRLTHGSCNFSKGARHPDTLRQPYELVAA